MGLFNAEQVKRLKDMGIQVDVNKDYTTEKKENMAFKFKDYIIGHSTKNNDI